MNTYITSPANMEEARQIIDWLTPGRDLAERQRSVSQSMRLWSKEGCHLFAKSAKACYAYEHGNMVGIMLRSLANMAIILEHRRSH